MDTIGAGFSVAGSAAVDSLEELPRSKPPFHQDYAANIRTTLDKLQLHPREVAPDAVATSFTYVHSTIATTATISTGTRSD